jgi:hypothetical protein
MPTIAESGCGLPSLSDPLYCLAAGHLDTVSARGVMIAVWPDLKSEMQSLTIREITARIFGETDPKKLHELVEQLRVIVEAQLRTHPPN